MACPGATPEQCFMPGGLSPHAGGPSFWLLHPSHRAPVYVTGVLAGCLGPPGRPEGCPHTRLSTLLLGFIYGLSGPVACRHALACAQSRHANSAKLDLQALLRVHGGDSDVMVM